MKRQIPAAWKKANVIAILKTGKPADLPCNCHPIGPLSVTGKLMDRALLSRLTPTMEAFLPDEQRGFRPSRSTCDQVLALSTLRGWLPEKTKDGNRLG